MKKGQLTSILIIFTLCLPGLLFAKTTVSLKGVHLCCKSCVTGVAKAAQSAGATATSQPQQRLVVIEAPDDATASKAVAAVAKAGYYGKSSNPAIAISTDLQDATVTSATVTGVHLCCGKCVRAVDKAIDSLKGASGHSAEKKSATFKVTGSFSLKALSDALHANGLHGQISK
jgi:copper chaperone CopZ